MNCFQKWIDQVTTSWWFQPIWQILVKLDHFPKDRAENRVYLKPAPRGFATPVSTVEMLTGNYRLFGGFSGSAVLSAACHKGFQWFFVYTGKVLDVFGKNTSSQNNKKCKPLPDFDPQKIATGVKQLTAMESASLLFLGAQKNEVPRCYNPCVDQRSLTVAPPKCVSRPQWETITLTSSCSFTLRFEWINACPPTKKEAATYIEKNSSQEPSIAAWLVLTQYITIFEGIRVYIYSIVIFKSRILRFWTAKIQSLELLDWVGSETIQQPSATPQKANHHFYLEKSVVYDVWWMSLVGCRWFLPQGL